jgi:hypothetical protein
MMAAVWSFPRPKAYGFELSDHNQNADQCRQELLPIGRPLLLLFFTHFITSFPFQKIRLMVHRLFITRAAVWHFLEQPPKWSINHESRLPCEKSDSPEIGSGSGFKVWQQQK